MSDVDAVGARADALLGAAVEMRRETAWSGSLVDAYGGADPPDLANAIAQAAVDRAVFLLRNLPKRYSEGLGKVADAIIQGAVDVSYADDPTGEM